MSVSEDFMLPLQLKVSRVSLLWPTSANEYSPPQRLSGSRLVPIDSMTPARLPVGVVIICDWTGLSKLLYTYVPLFFICVMTSAGSSKMFLDTSAFAKWVSTSVVAILILSLMFSKQCWWLLKSLLISCRFKYRWESVRSRYIISDIVRNSEPRILFKSWRIRILK